MSERLHPYDMVFGTAEFEEEKFPAIRDEAEARDVDVRDAQRFIMLETVGDLMRSLLPPDADVPATTQFAAIVTHALHTLSGVGVGPCSQLSYFARIRAIEVLPVPRGPANR